MDALEFLKERSRMCKSYTDCGGCPLERGNCGLSTSTSVEECERIITAVEQWSKEHPHKTRQSVFLKNYPDAVLDQDGILTFCPMKISSTYRNSEGKCKTLSRMCSRCCREFWMGEAE